VRAGQITDLPFLVGTSRCDVRAAFSGAIPVGRVTPCAPPSFISAFQLFPRIKPNQGQSRSSVPGVSCSRRARDQSNVAAGIVARTRRGARAPSRASVGASPTETGVRSAQSCPCPALDSLAGRIPQAGEDRSTLDPRPVFSFFPESSPNQGQSRSIKVKGARCPNQSRKPMVKNQESGKRGERTPRVHRSAPRRPKQPCSLRLNPTRFPNGHSPEPPESAENLK
jgi:hypothetical protein